VRGVIVCISRPGSRCVFALLAAATLLASSLGIEGLAGVVAHFGPALLLLAALASGLYPGEIVVARLRRRAPARRRRPAPFRRERRMAPRAFAFRARLLAYHLAVRPPPVGAAPVA
jgi:hypothetical protein